MKELKYTLTTLAAASMTLGTLVPMAFASTGTSYKNVGRKAFVVNNQTISNPYVLTALDSGNTTSFLGMYYFDQALQKLGATATWDGNNHVWAITAPGVDASKISIAGGVGTGNTTITVNGVTVKKINTFAAKDPAGSIMTTYFPAYYVNELFTSFGFNTKWDGQAGLTVTSNPTNVSVNSISVVDTKTVKVTFTQNVPSSTQADKFDVEQNGQQVAVSDVAISSDGTSATLTLANALSSNAFTVNGVTDNELSAPTLVSATADSNSSTVSLNFSKTLNDLSTPSYKDFVVELNGAPVTIAPYVDVEGSQVNLTLVGKTINPSSDTVLVSYTQGTNPIEDTFGGKVASFSMQPVSTAAIQAVTNVKAVANAGAKATITFTAPTSGTAATSYDLQASVNGGQFVTVEKGIQSGATYQGVDGNSVAFQVVSNDSNSKQAAVSSSSAAVTLDGTAPTISSATANGNQLVLNYSEPVIVAPTSGDVSGDYTVTLNGSTSDTVTAASIAGNQVTLTLKNAVSSTDTVTASYSGSLANKVSDAAGNLAVSTTSDVTAVNQTQLNASQIVADAADSSTAKVVNGSIAQEYELQYNGVKVPLDSADVISITETKPDGSIVKLTPSSDTTLWFNVSNAAGKYTFDVVSTAGAKYEASLNWTAPTTIKAAKTGVVDSTAGTEFALGDGTTNINLNGATGVFEVKPDGTIGTTGTDYTLDTSHDLEMNVPSAGAYTFFVDQAGKWSQVAINSTADFVPTLKTATVDSTHVTLTYDTALLNTSTPAGTDFVVDVNGQPVAASNVVVSGTTVTFDLASPVKVGDTVTLNYTPGTNVIKGAAGNGLSAAGLNSQAVTNKTTGPVLSGAVFDTTATPTETLTLSYTTDGNVGLDSSSAPAASDFAVTVAGQSDAVTGVSIVNNTVVLTLAVNPTSSQTVSVSYTPGQNPVKDVNGSAASAVTNQIVAVN